MLHGARGLTNAMGALADLRRNEMGTVVVVGLPSTGSQPFLPPHGETGLVPGAGAFAKSWFEAEAVPAEPGARRAYVESFVDGLRRAIELENYELAAHLRDTIRQKEASDESR